MSKPAYRLRVSTDERGNLRWALQRKGRPHYWPFWYSTSYAAIKAEQLSVSASCVLIPRQVVVWDRP